MSQSCQECAISLATKPTELSFVGFVGRSSLLQNSLGAPARTESANRGLAIGGQIRGPSHADPKADAPESAKPTTPKIGGEKHGRKDSTEQLADKAATAATFQTLAEWQNRSDRNFARLAPHKRDDWVETDLHKCDRYDPGTTSRRRLCLRRI
jgi:hypothetical protein